MSDLLNGWREDGEPDMTIDDTGERRRLTDMVSTNEALELLAALAMESALRNGDTEVQTTVEHAILRLRLTMMEKIQNECLD